MTPIPGGEISTTEIWNNKPKKKYDVELILKRRVKVVVESESEENACVLAQQIYDSGDNTKFDELIIGPDATVTEL